jgi:PAS domain S-box-containing protein
VLTVRTRFYLTTAVTALIVILGSVNEIRADADALHEFHEVELHEYEATLAGVMGLGSVAVSTWVFDNTFWDDMGAFVDGGCIDEPWALDNLESAHGSVGLQGLYLLAPDGRSCFTSQSEGFALAQDPAWAATLSTVVRSPSRVNRFYMASGGAVVEIFYATIHASADRAHAGPIGGYLVAARKLDEQALGGVTAVVRGDVRIVAVGAPLPAESVGEVAALLPLNGIDGRPVAQLLGTRVLTRLAAMEESQARRGALVLAAGLISVLGLIYLQRRWLFLPFERLTRSVAAGDAKALRALEASADEFGALARVLIRVFAFRDEEQKMIAALREESTRRHQLSVALERAGNAVAITDVSFRIIWANQAYCAVHGYAESTVVGRHPLRVQLGDASPDSAAMLSTLSIAEGRSVVLSRAPSGETFWNEIDVRPYHDDAGERLGYTLIESDVTERRLSDELSQVSVALNEAASPSMSREAFLERALAALRTISGVCSVRIEPAASAERGLTDPEDDAILSLTTDIPGAAGAAGRLVVELTPEAPRREALRTGIIEVGKRIVEMLAQRDDRLRFAAVFQYSPDALLLLDPQGRMHGANPAALAMLSALPKLGAVPLAELVEGCAEALQRVLGPDASVATFDTETFVRLDGGARLAVDARYTRVGGPDGDSALLTLRDIRARLAAEAELAAQRDVATRLHALRDALGVMLGRLPVSILLLDADGSISYVNDACRDLLGVSSTMSLPIVLPAELARALDLAELTSEAYTATARRPLDRELPRCDGERIWVELSAESISLNDQEHLLVSLVEISARKKSESALRDARDLAEQSLSAKDAFLANTSHELRTPMNAIVGFTHLLGQTALDERQADWVKKVGIAARHLLELLHELLDHAKLTAGKLELEQGPLVFGDLVEPLVELFTDRAHEKGIELVTTIAPELRGTLLGDGRRLKQVLLNLLSNAVKFTEHGRVEVTATVADLSATQCTVAIEIRDTGIGMSAVDLERIFQPFVQVDNSRTRRFGGTGLGLSISRTVLELMGGRLSVRSELGVGSVFRCLVPLSRVDAAPPAPPIAEADGLRLARLKNTRILIVEDNAINEEILLELLAPYGISPVVARTGKEALERIATAERERGATPFDLVLMDIQMPEMDGLEATRIIRALPDPDAARQPIVAMTAHSMERDRLESVAAGMNGHLNKPIEPQALERLLLDWLAPRPEGA